MGAVTSLEDVHQVIAEYDRNHPPESWYDRRTREAREAREAEERNQHARDARRRREAECRAASNANNSDGWQRFFEGCIHAWFRRSPNPMLDAIGQAMGQLRDELREELRNEFKAAIAELEAKLVATERRLKAVPGRLPVVKTWGPETVTYEAEVVAHEGALYQARRDTAQTPGGSDWTCAGRDGRDGRSPSFRGPFDARGKYARFDIVAFDGTSFIARRDDPGICPGDGDGWQALASRGKPGIQGPPGPRGARGARGEPGLSTASWHIDPPNYRAVEFLSNGEPGPELNLLAFFERYHDETSEE